MASNDKPHGLSFLWSRMRTDPEMQIQVLATMGATLLGFQALLGSRRRRCNSKVFLVLLWAAYTVSASVVSYTVGLVQSTDEENQTNRPQWWAVGLLLLLGSADTMSAFTRGDAEQSKGMMVQHVVQTVLVLWLLVSRASEIRIDRATRRTYRAVNWNWTITLFFCWLYSILKMAQRIKALRMASSSHGLVRTAKVVADYMQDAVERERRDEAGRDYDPADMRGYKYLVHGEMEHSKPPSGPDYRTQVPVGEGSPDVVTIDRIWHCGGELLSSGDDQARALKDTCLSFALFNLLKRRFCGLEVAEAGQKKARDLVLRGLLAGNDHERAFRVVELELSFAHDFFYTKYPALFPTSRALRLARFVFLLAFFKLLYNFAYGGVYPAVVIIKILSSVFIFSIFTDFYIILMLLGIEVMQQLSTSYSNWAIVHFVCKYVRRVEGTTGAARCKTGWYAGGGGVQQAVIKRVAARRARKSRHWQNRLGQYSLLHSYDYHPSAYNRLSWLTGRLLEPTREGRKSSPAIKLRGEVKKAVLRSLRESGGRLTNGRSSLEKEDTHHGRNLLWACSLPTHAHTVLVWHVATTLCDHMDDGAAAAVRVGTGLLCCGGYHQRQVQDGAAGDDGAGAGGSDEHRRVATALSGYCAYLLAFVPEMLPDHSYTATQILDAVVQEARDQLGDIKGGMPMADKCRKMLTPLPGAAGEPAPQSGGGGMLLADGGRLGRQLMAVGYEARWKLLAELWAELVLYLAPSDNADVHAESLARGGELMTHLWALLTHAGILDRHAATPAGSGAV